MKKRLDILLVERGLAESRTQAQALVLAGLVPGYEKPGHQVDESAELSIEAPPRYVSRGGEKLANALAQVEVELDGRDCLDLGASTGGFTDALLQRGAAAVVAVDVGYGQLAEPLRRHPAVTVHDRLHVRDATAEGIGGAGDIVVADLSFISLANVAGALARLGNDTASWVLLVKPQFEAGREAVGRTGVVQDPEVWQHALGAVIEALTRVGLGVLAVVPSRLPGTKGNKEFFVHARRGCATVTPHDIHLAVTTAGTL